MVKFAKNIAIITISIDDIVNYRSNELTFINIFYMNGIKNAYKIHVFIDESGIVKEGKLKQLIDIVGDIRDILGTSKVLIHSFSKRTYISDADTLWAQNFSIDDSYFISVRKQNNKLNIVKYRKCRDCYY